MSLTASSLLARLEELKKWQAKQQQRLTEQQSSLKDCTNASSNFDTIEGLSQFDSTSEISRNDLKPPPRSILNSSKTSGKTLNNYNDETAVRYNENSKLKMPYLRRGSGLVRYKMNPGDQKRPFNRIIQRKRSNSNNYNNNTKTSKSYGDIPHDSDPVEITPLKRPDINIKAVWFKIGDEGQAIINNADRNLSDNNVAKKTILQINELAAQNSLCANANFKLNDEAEVKSKLKSSDISEINEKLTEMALHSEQSLYEQQLERELLIFEALEEKALNSSFSSTNSSVLHILSSTPSKLKSRNLAKNFIQEKVEYQNHITDDIIEEIEEDNLTDKEFNQAERDKIPSLESSVTSDDFQDKPLEEAWSDINTIVYTRENSSLSSASLSRKNSEPENTLISQSDYTEAIANKEEIDETRDILARKLKELDKEIENFRKENANLQRAKLQLEKEEREFKNEKRAFEKHILEEKINAEFYLEDEKKKLAKEKVIFERYVKDIQNKTTRKEREEISALKEEIANLKEASKLKETRNATSQARLRNQIKSYEKEISNLREELENLRKRNAKLLSSQQFVKKSSETKMLHEINKNLTKLTKDVKVGEKLKKIENNLEKIEVAEDVRKNSVDRNEIKDFFYGQVRSDSKSKTDQSLLYNDQDLCKNYDAFLKDNSKIVFDKANGSVEHVLDDKEDDRSIERSYEMVFGKSPTREEVRSDISVAADKNTTINETTLADGSREITYPNGNVKTTSADGNYIRMKYYNGDIKETKLLDGVIRYYYIENQSWQTTMADGTEILEFPNGQIERKFKDGSIEVKFPNGIVQMTKSNGSQSILYPDKTQVDIDANGEKIIHLPNGQKEIHNSEHMRREYPDGTVKIVYPDGIQETRYGNGRIRIKDKDGNLLLDSYDCNS